MVDCDIPDIIYCFQSQYKLWQRLWLAMSRLEDEISGLCVHDFFQCARKMRKLGAKRSQVTTTRWKDKEINRYRNNKIKRKNKKKKRKRKDKKKRKQDKNMKR